MAPDDITLNHQLCFALYGASMAIGRAYKPLLDVLGITYPQYLVLSTLWERGAQSVGGIAERLALESSTVTPLVKRLEQAGKNFQVEVFKNAGHAFFADYRPSYREAPAFELWPKMVAFFRKHLVE